MLDIRFIRENPELVRENIRKKFQDKKLPLVDEVLELDEKLRAAKTEANELRANRNALSKKIGMLMGQAKKDQEQPAIHLYGNFLQGAARRHRGGQPRLRCGHVAGRDPLFRLVSGRSSYTAARDGRFLADSEDVRFSSRPRYPCKGGRQ